MKILYANDLRDLPNFGCRTTGPALCHLLEKRNSVIGRIGIESVHQSGWDAYATHSFRTNGILPRRCFDLMWVNRIRLGRVWQAYVKFEEALGARTDYIATDPEVSVEQFIAAAPKYPQLSRMLHLANDCDIIVINGEGTLIFANPTKRDAFFLLFTIALGRRLGKRVILANAMVAPCPYSEPRAQDIALAQPYLEYCDRIVCREKVSAAYVNQIASKARVNVVPDALFTRQSQIRSTIPLVCGSPDAIIPFGAERFYGKWNFNGPYICVSGSSSASRHGERTIESYCKLVAALRKITKNIVLVATCDGDNFLEEVSRVTESMFIPVNTPVLAGAAVIANARVYVSGRYHPGIMASCGGTPCIFMEANSHKTLSLQQVLEYPSPITFSDAPHDDEIERIARAASDMYDEGDPLRSRILAAASKRAQEAEAYSTLLEWGQDLHPTGDKE